MIEVNNLTKLFGNKKAVDDVTFQVAKGEILGFLGPNGAGKSTSMRMITGFIPPSSGTAVIGGHDILGEPIAARRKIGYLPENAPVYPDMTVFGYLDFCAEIRGFSGADRKRKVEAAIEKCFLRDVKFQAVSTLSKGFKQRVCFAQSIIHDPEYLILDEPTDGLDPNQKHEVRLMIRNMSAEKAIVLSTHILDEVDAVCTRAIIIADGKIVADDTPAGLKTRSVRHGAVSLSLNSADPDSFFSCIRDIEGIKDTKILEQADDFFRVRVFPESPDILIADRLMSVLSEKGFAVKSLFVEQGRLDEVFRTVTSPAGNAENP
ncbi:MAG: ABC transporter ATP-binding protein [Desulfococcaceae bacterium]|jgi:ABC-2 type transport system ATP-binding protein|nr:ABC transporter ATP-binding protein [Desulfococcaceae bacterium]